MAKALIHEAFHIYGGCWGSDPDTGHFKYDPDIDTACNLNKLNLIYSQIQGKDKTRVGADAFAQYVMLS